MTGDGVNDAPALCQADIGVAMGSGTKVAGCVADVVLRDDKLADIAAAIEEGRRAFANIGKVITYWLGINVGEMLVSLMVLFLMMPKPYEAANQMAMGLTTGTLGVLPLCFEPAERAVMKDAPRARKDSPVPARVWRWIVVPFWLVFSTAAIGTLYAGLRMHVGAHRGPEIAQLCSFAYACDGGVGTTCTADTNPYMCRCLASGTEQWGRQQTEGNNFEAQFTAATGLAGIAYAREEGPWDRVSEEGPLGPCSPGSADPFGDALPRGARCWRPWALRRGGLVGPDGRTTQTQARVYEAFLLDQRNCVRQGTLLAKSMGWHTMVLAQLAFLHCLRSPRPLLETFTRNSTSLLLLCVSLLISECLMYVPKVNAFFDLAPLGLVSFAITMIGPAMVVLTVEGSKSLLREWQRQNLKGGPT
uniref:Cation-transporting P-type ATPase C-terminal domain-containing protein n=1 Tax=Zooxanthella nutricula TaxID=1333877 RepID=A0A7S2N2Q8_9DINO